MIGERRINWIDTSRGFAILLVVIGHACIPALCNKYQNVEILYAIINSINMPIFFYLSGFIFFGKRVKNSTKSTKELIVKKAYSLLFPYSSYLLFVYIVFFSLQRITLTRNLLIKAGYIVEVSGIIFIKDLVLSGGYIDKHLWFLYVLFFIFLIGYMIKLLDLNIISILIVNVIIVLLVMIRTDLNINSPLWKILYYFSFFSLGYIRIDKFIITRRKTLYILLLILGFLEFINISLILSDEYVVSVIRVVRYALGFLSIFLFVFLSNIVSYRKLNNVFNYFGKKSLFIYLFHQPFLVSGSALVLMRKIDSPLLIICISSLLGIMVSLFIHYFLSFITNYSKTYINEIRLK